MSQPCVLVLHSSRFGQSTKIAQAICDKLNASGVATELAALTNDTAPDPQRFNALVLVMSVRYGHFDKAVDRLITHHLSWMESVPTLLVTVSLTARNPEKCDPAIHSYTRKFLEATPWKPTHTEVVAGMLEYPRYNIFDRVAIQLIMHMTKGPTDKHTVIEYTNWDRVATMAGEFADVVKTASNNE